MHVEELGEDPFVRTNIINIILIGLAVFEASLQ